MPSARAFLSGLSLLPLLAAPRAQVPPYVQEARQALADDLVAYAQAQMAGKGLPAVCIAVYDRGGGPGADWMFATGLGTADRERGEAAGAGTVLRVASISKLVTATAVMVLAERGLLDLDAPVTAYVPSFRPQGEGAAGITLRHLLSHKGGLVRESPVGHYFDAGAPGLHATVASLEATELVYPPGARFKYSNPGPGVAGMAIEAVMKKPFEQAVRELVLEPLGLHDSDFAPRADLVARTAKGVMWTPDGRAIPTPEFEFGYGPAANLRSTVLDLVGFARSWFPEAKARVLRPETQAAMWEVPFAAPGTRQGCALGFFVGTLDGHRKVEHGGAVYGCAIQLVALPEAGLCAAVATTVDFANAVVEAIAERALRGMLLAREGKRLEPAAAAAAVGAARARELAGRYVDDRGWLDLLARGEELYLEPSSGERTRIRSFGGELRTDDRVSMGRVLRVPDGGKAVGYRGRTFARVAEKEPAECPPQLLPYLGEYGWDFDVLVVFEDQGRLCVLIEWLVRAVLEEVAEDRFRFPDGTMYSGDAVVFERDDKGRVTGVRVGGTRFPARPWPEGPFRIAPRRPVPELRAELAGAEPPVQPEGLRAPDLVDLAGVVPGVKLDVRYASADNFLGTAVYDAAVARLQRPAVQALARVAAALRDKGYGLVVFDGYRPWSVTKLFFEATPEELRHFVADPAQGSRHNRGCAVDLSLYELASGAVVAMPSGYDEFTVRAYPDWPGGTSRQRWHRELLRQAMAAEGFEVYEHEWWHFDFRSWREYPVLDVPLR